MNRRVILAISVFPLLLNSCASGGSQRNSENLGQGTKPTPTATVALSTAQTPPTASATSDSSKSKLVVITDKNYDEVVGSNSVALILFWAPWSAPDRLMVPVVEALADEYANTLKAGKVDVDENPALAQKFNIRGIPTVVLIKDGTERERMVGVASKKMMRELLDKHVVR